MWNHNNSTTLSLICTRIVMAATFTALFFVPKIVDFFIYRGTVVESGRIAVIICVYVCLAVGAVILYLLDRLLHNIQKEDIFISRNVEYLRGISWACFALCIPCLVITIFCRTFFFILLAAGFMGLILRVVKNVIEEAVVIKEENDYTV